MKALGLGFKALFLIKCSQKFSLSGAIITLKQMFQDTSKSFFSTISINFLNKYLYICNQSLVLESLSQFIICMCYRDITLRRLHLRL